MSLFKSAARAAVVTRVVGSTHRRQQQRWAAQDAAAQTPATPATPAAPSTPAASAQPDLSEQLEQLSKLGELRAAGVLTEAEFESRKALILGTA